MVTGATGRLGGRVVKLLARSLPSHHLLATASRSNCSGGYAVASLDLRDRDAVIARVRAYRPDIVIHLGALASVEESEVEHRRALEVNALSTFALVEAADAVGAYVAYVSTDFVFDGEVGRYVETDPTHPVSHYGRTKRLGELGVESPHLVVRLPLLFGHSVNGTPTRFDLQIESLRRYSRLTAYDDEFRSPLSYSHASRVVVGLAARRYPGVVHVAGAERVSPLQLLRSYARVLDVQSVALTPASRLTAAGPPRPRDVSLRCERLASDVPELLAPPLAADVAAELGVALRRGPRTLRGTPRFATSARRVTATAPASSRRGVTVFIPAHQNASQLGRCLASLATQSFLRHGALRVVVVCNACTDNTVEVAEQWRPRLARLGAETLCLDLRQGGRASALNAGEMLVGQIPGPRVYLDADVYLSPGALDDLAEVLAPGTGVGFAVPQVEATTSHSWLTRSYARLWTSVPYVNKACSTIGMYAVSEEGRTRWERFPEIHSDDKWVRLHFARSERAVVASSSYSVALPEGIAELYRARLRYERGNKEIRELFPELLDDEPRRYGGLGCLISRRPNTWVPAACLGALQGAALIGTLGWRASVR